jgi:hypothetical protein
MREPGGTKKSVRRRFTSSQGGRFAILLLRSEALALKLAQDRLHSPPILIAVLNHRRQ